MTSPKGGGGGEERRLARKGMGGSDACTGIYGGRKGGYSRRGELGEDALQSPCSTVRAIVLYIYVRTKWYLHHERGIRTERV